MIYEKYISFIVNSNFRNCEKCEVVTLGIYTKSVNFAKFGDKIELSKWISSRHNMGFVIDR